jgi:hypothetical protein
MAKLINVRLNDEDEAKLAALRAQGQEVSDLVRKAIRSEYERRKPAKRTAVDAERIMRELDEKYPTPADAPRHGIDTTNRQEVQQFIREQLEQKRRAAQ